MCKQYTEMIVIERVLRAAFKRPCAAHGRPESLEAFGLAARADGFPGWAGRPASVMNLAFQSLSLLAADASVLAGPAASRQTAFRPRVSGRGCPPLPPTLAFSSRFAASRQNARSLAARGIARRFAAKRRGGALPPKSDRALGRPLGSVRPIPRANVAPNIAARYCSRRRYRFCLGSCPYSPHPDSAPPGPSAWPREAR